MEVKLLIVNPYYLHFIVGIALAVKSDQGLHTSLHKTKQMFILMFYLQKNTFENMNKAKNLILSYLILFFNLILSILLPKI